MLDVSGSCCALLLIMKDMLNLILIIIIFLKQHRSVPDELHQLWLKKFRINFCGTLTFLSSIELSRDVIFQVLVLHKGFIISAVVLLYGNLIMYFKKECDQYDFQEV